VKKLQKVGIVTGAILVVLVGLYLMVVYSNIPFIKKYRTLYIETAMSTLEHQWLATAFIPKSVIDKVIQEKIAQENEIDKLLEKWQDVKVFDMQKDLEIEQPVQEEQEDPERAAFFAKYWEIDQESFDEYVSNNPDILANGYDNLYINKGKLGDEGTTIKTIMGEQVMIIDAKNNLLIVRVHTDDYDGRMAIIKDPRQVKVGCASTMGTIGQLVRTIAKEKGAPVRNG
jgi:exopolysaccharide biosynthesis protein